MYSIAERIGVPEEDILEIHRRRDSNVG